MNSRGGPAAAGGAVWGLNSGRPGEFQQVVALGSSLGLPFETVRLSPLGALPTTLPDERPPQLIISFGRAARAALQLRNALPGPPLTVHLGTPGQLPTAAFDLIIPMPQDDYPQAPNVQFLGLPLNGATFEAAELPTPGPGTAGTVIIIGGPSRHFRFSQRDIRRIVRFGARLANANAEPLQVITSPRTPPAMLAWMQGLLTSEDFTLHVYGGGGAPFVHFLKNGARFVVSTDSASMVADACRTGAPVWLFPLASQPNLMTFLQKSWDSCFGCGLRHHLVRRGWLGGGTDYRRWHRALATAGFIKIARDVRDADLTWRPVNLRLDADLNQCRSRIIRMLGVPPDPVV